MAIILVRLGIGLGVCLGCCTYRYQRLSKCCDCCYACDMSILKKRAEKKQENVLIDWQDAVVFITQQRNVKTGKIIGKCSAVKIFLTVDYFLF